VGATGNGEKKKLLSTSIKRQELTAKWAEGGVSPSSFDCQTGHRYCTEAKKVSSGKRDSRRAFKRGLLILRKWNRREELWTHGFVWGEVSAVTGKEEVLGNGVSGV